jgi:hypothetical protein
VSYRQDELELRDFSNGLRSEKEWRKFNGEQIQWKVVELLRRLFGDEKVSDPHAFVSDNDVEFDAIVVKDRRNFYSGFYNTFQKDDVLALIEIKRTGLYVTTSEEIQDCFEDMKLENHSSI